MEINQPRPSVELAVHCSNLTIRDVHRDDPLGSHTAQSRPGPSPYDFIAAMEDLFRCDGWNGWRSGLDRNELRLRCVRRSVELERSARFQ